MNGSVKRRDCRATDAFLVTVNLLERRANSTLDISTLNSITVPE